MANETVKEVTASMSVRVNVGDYQGTEFFVSMKAEVTELDPLDVVLRETQAAVCQAMVDNVRRSYAARGKTLTDDQVRRQHGIPAP